MNNIKNRPNLQDRHSLCDASANLAGNIQRKFLAQVEQLKKICK